MKRPVIVHYHMYKNAGSSVDAILRANFRERWLSFDTGTPGAVIGTSELQRYLLAHPEALAVSSHQCRPPLPDDPSLAVFPLFLLRHPLDRVQSVYRFGQRRLRRGRPPGRFAAVRRLLRLDAVDDQGPSLAGFVDSMLGSPEGKVLRDFQANYLAGRRSKERVPEKRELRVDVLENAVSLLRALPSFGIVERFDETVRRFDAWLKPSFKDLNFFPARKNVTSDLSVPIGERIGGLRGKLGADLFARLALANESDLVLYEEACRMFDARAAGEQAPVPAGKLGVVVGFGEGGEGVAALASGWHPPYRKGVWASEHRSTLRLPVPKELRDVPEVSLTLGLRASRSHGNRVRLYLNGELAAERDLTDKGIQSVRLERTVRPCSQGELALEVESENLEEPEALGIAADGRKLGVFLVHLQLLRVPELLRTRV